MLTINVKTKAITGWDRRNPMARNSFGDATPGYVRGHIPPNYPVPVPLSVAEYDLEYVWLLYERARLTQELRDVRGDTKH